MLTKERKEYIELLAQSVVDTIKMKVPIDIKRVVYMLGGRISYEDNIYDYKDISVRKIDNKFEILTSRNLTDIELENYFIAIILGYVFIHCDYFNSEEWSKHSEIDSSILNDEEKLEEAKYFALAILIPQKEFKSRIELNKEFYGHLNIEDLSKYFFVSSKLVEKRYEEFI